MLFSSRIEGADSEASLLERYEALLREHGNARKRTYHFRHWGTCHMYYGMVETPDEV